MNIGFTPEQQQIRESVSRLCQRFDDNYWLARDTDGVFPEDFCQAIADEGWMGAASCSHSRYRRAGGDDILTNDRPELARSQRPAGAIKE